MARRPNSKQIIYVIYYVYMSRYSRWQIGFGSNIYVEPPPLSAKATSYDRAWKKKLKPWPKFHRRAVSDDSD